MIIFSLLAGLISLYTLLCFFRIILTWIPSLNYSKVGRFFSQVCDPYMNYFRRFRFLRFGNIDFSPILSLGLLVAASNIFTNIATTGRLGVGYILASIVSVVWSIVASVIGFLLILLVIRLIALFINKGSSSSFWYTLDNTLNPVVYKVAGIFRGKNNFMTQNTAYIITIVVLLILRFAGGFVFSLIAGIFARLPF